GPADRVAERQLPGGRRAGLARADPRLPGHLAATAVGAGAGLGGDRLVVRDHRRAQAAERDRGDRRRPVCRRAAGLAAVAGADRPADAVLLRRYPGPHRDGADRRRPTFDRRDHAGGRARVGAVAVAGRRPRSAGGRARCLARDLDRHRRRRRAVCGRAAGGRARTDPLDLADPRVPGRGPAGRVLPRHHRRSRAALVLSAALHGGAADRELRAVSNRMTAATRVVPPGFADPDAVAGPVTLRQPVAWGELDALGHVNHTIFLRWFENVRSARLERVGIGATARARSGVGPILARIECDCRATAELPDAIWVSARCIELGRSSLRLQSRVWSEQRAAIVAEGAVVVVMFDYPAQRSVAIPEVVRAAIVALDQPGEPGGGRGG